MNLDSMEVDLSKELKATSNPIVDKQPKAAQATSITSIKWRPAPTRREQDKWDRATKAATGGSDVMFRDLRKPKGDPKVLAAKSREQYFKVVKILPSYDQSVSGTNDADEEGWAPLHSAASSGNVEMVKVLLDKGADVKLKIEGGRTALHYAASKGWVKVAEILLSNGANINSKDKRHKGVADPFEVVAGEISNESILLCLDEFMV